MNNLKLSILMPTIPERREAFIDLFSDLMDQAANEPVEVIAVLDNKKRTIGAKCNDLISMAKGEYLTFVDDDDLIARDYVRSILDSMECCEKPDVITFQVNCTLTRKDGSQQQAIIFPDVNDPNEEFHDGFVKRKPLQIAVWKSDLAKSSKWADAQNEADTAWASKLWPKIKIQKKISKVLYWYQWSALGTAAK